MKEFPVTEIQTTTAGSLPRTKTVIDANAALAFDDDGFALSCLRA